MRKLLSIILIGVSAVSLQANNSNIKFYEGSWTETLEQAKEANNLVFLDCYTDWCYWCKVMDKETFTDTSVSNMINQKFIPARREMEKTDEGKALGMKYHVNGYPTYLIFNAAGQLVYEIVGYRVAADFKAELNKALQANNPLHPGFSTALDPGFPDFYKNSFGTSKERKKPEAGVVNSWLDKQTDLTSEVSWGVMWRFTVSEKYENWIFDNKKKLSELYGKDEVDSKIVDIIFARVDRAAEKKDVGAFKAARALVDVHVPDQAAWLNFQLSLNYFEKTEDWKGYADAVQNEINTNGYAKGSTINGCAWTIYEKCEDKAVITQATGWMAALCETTEEYAYEDTYAALLYKNGDYKKAEEVALHAIDLGKAGEDDVSGTEALLVNIRLKLK